jgi:adenylyltransferase/sulfurtransferase
VLHFISEKRRIKLKGYAFREFQRLVVPLLDGRHTVGEIVEEVQDVFAADDLEAALQLLADQELLEEGDGEIHLTGDLAAIRPQLNLFHALGAAPREAQTRLEKATVSILGAGGAGATASLLLAACRVGTLRILDASSVAPADTYLAPEFSLEDVGFLRAEALSRKIRSVSPEVNCIVQVQALESDDDVLTAIGASDFVLGSVDAGQSSLLYKLNRVCRKNGIPWIATTTSAIEVVVGPAVAPQDKACYLCYKMRVVACSENPEDEFAFQSFLDRRKRDDSAQRENNVFGTVLAGNLAALEIIKAISRISPVVTHGQVVIFDLLNLSTTKHQVLRKPWCPVCYPNAATSEGNKI